MSSAVINHKMLSRRLVITAVESLTSNTLQSCISDEMEVCYDEVFCSDSIVVRCGVVTYGA